MKIRFVFIEKDKRRADNLQEIIDGFDFPENFRTEVLGGEEFEEAFRKVLRSYGEKGLPPTFAFIDPFGWSGVPFSIVAQIMKHTALRSSSHFHV